MYENNVLQFFAHEEGRIRKKGNDYVFDYFLKDHLGNVRMVLTDEVKADTYMCTMEDGAISTEGQLFRLYRVFFICKSLTTNAVP